MPTRLPLREESTTNDLNTENVPPCPRWSEIPEDTRLIPVTEDIQVYKVPQESWLEAEAVSDEEDERLRMLRNRRVGGPRLAPRQLIDRQTCVKSTRVDPYPARMALGGKRGAIRYSLPVGVNRKSQ